MLSMHAYAKGNPTKQITTTIATNIFLASLLPCGLGASREFCEGCGSAINAMFHHQKMHVTTHKIFPACMHSELSLSHFLA